MTTKETIMDAALKLYMEKGVAHTRFSDIAKLAGIEQNHLKYHYKSNDQLFMDVLAMATNSLQEETQAAIDFKKHKDIESMISAYAAVTFQWGKKNKSLRNLWLYLYYLSSVSDEYREINQKLRIVGRDRIRSMLVEGIARKALKSEILDKIDELTIQIQSIIIGNSIITWTENDIKDNWIMKKTTEQILQLLLM